MIRILSRFVLLIAVLSCIALPAIANEKLVIGAEDDWSPYSGAVNGKPVGFAVDLVRAAYAAVGVKVELVSLPYARCMKMTLENKLHGCFDTLRNALLENKYRWHKQPLFKARINIYALNTHPDTVVKFEDLHGKRIAVTNGYDYGARFDGDKTMIRDMGNGDLQAMRKLALGRVDYALVYDRIANNLQRKHPELQGRIKPVGVLIEPEIYLSFAPKRSDVPHYIDLLDRGLVILQENGEYAKLEAQWR